MPVSLLEAMIVDAGAGPALRDQAGFESLQPVAKSDPDAWFAALMPQQQPQSQGAPAHLHNLKNFLFPLYASRAESSDAARRARLPPFVTKALKQLD